MAAVIVRVAAFLIVVSGLWFAAALVIGVVHSERKKRALAARFACLGCHVLLGDEAVALGQEQWLKHMERLRMLNPMRRLRVARTMHLQCTRCGARYRYDEPSNALVRVEVTLAFESPDSVRSNTSV